MASHLETGLKKSAAKLADKYRTPEGIAELKQKGFSDEMIEAMQKMAEEDAERGVFRDE